MPRLQNAIVILRLCNETNGICDLNWKQAVTVVCNLGIYSQRIPRDQQQSAWSWVLVMKVIAVTFRDDEISSRRSGNIAFRVVNVSGECRQLTPEIGRILRRP